jgi:hypothetical protein
MVQFLTQVVATMISAFLAVLCIVLLNRAVRFVVDGRRRKHLYISQGICPVCGAAAMRRDQRAAVPAWQGARYVPRYIPVLRCMECQNEFDIPRTLNRKRADEAYARKVEEEANRIVSDARGESSADRRSTN